MKVLYSEESGFEVASVIVIGKAGAALAEAFPQARVVAPPSQACVIKWFFGKIEHWEGAVGVMNIPRKVAQIEPLTRTSLSWKGTALR